MPKELDNIFKIKYKNNEGNDKLLVTWEGNYGDEFDLEGFQVMTRKDYDEMIHRLKSIKTELNWCFGTNEEMEYENGSDLASEFSARLLTETEYEVILRVIPTFGFTDAFDAAYSDFEGYDDEDEENDFLPDYPH